MQAFPDLVLADKRFFANEQVDLVLGGDLYPQILLNGIRKNVLSTLLAQETVFGWILTGSPGTAASTTNKVSFFSEVTLDKQLTAFWELENIPKRRTPNEEEKISEELYQRTTTGQIQLGPSLKIACSQFFRHV